MLDIGRFVNGYSSSLLLCLLVSVHEYDFDYNTENLHVTILFVRSFVGTVHIMGLTFTKHKCQTQTQDIIVVTVLTIPPIPHTPYEGT